MKTTTVKAYGTESAEALIHEMEIRRRSLLPNDVELDILFCGICHSDLHVAKNDWTGTTYPVLSGHEIIGCISKIGGQQKKIQSG